MTYATRTKAPFKEAPCFILKVEQEQSPSSCRLLLSLTTVPSFKWFQPVAGNRTEWPCSQQAFLSFFEKLLIVETQCQCANVSPNADENWYLLHLLMTDLNLKMSTMTLLFLFVAYPLGLPYTLKSKCKCMITTRHHALSLHQVLFTLSTTW